MKILLGILGLKMYTTPVPSFRTLLDYILQPNELANQERGHEIPGTEEQHMRDDAGREFQDTCYSLILERNHSILE